MADDIWVTKATKPKKNLALECFTETKHHKSKDELAEYVSTMESGGWKVQVYGTFRMTHEVKILQVAIQLMGEREQ